MKVLITGDEGFVGRHFTAACVARGWSVTGVDIRSGSDCRAVFAEDDPTRFDLVIHCAAMVGGRATIDGDPLAVAQNLAIDSDLFRWAARGGTGRVVYFSSSAAYPTFLQVPGSRSRLAEHDLTVPDVGYGAPDQTYGWAKLSGELLARHAEGDGVRTHIFRPFSGYGPDQDLTYPFPAFIDRAVRRVDPFEVWGDGTQTRDFVHIDDMVATVFAAVDGDYPEPLNLCTGRGTSFLLLADLVARAAGYRPTVTTLPDKPVGVHYRVGDPTAMNRVRAATVTLEEGIARAVSAVLG